MAKTLFLQQDVEHTSMKDIMQALGIAKGTIYHYFNSKEDLLEAVIDDMLLEYMQQLEAALTASQGSVLEQMQVLINAANVSSEQTELLEQIHRPGNIVLHTRLLAMTVKKIAPLFAKIIEQGCQEGVFETENPLETAEIVLAGIQFMTDVGCFPWSKADVERRVNAMPAIMQKQLGAPDGYFNFLIK